MYTVPLNAIDLNSLPRVVEAGSLFASGDRDSLCFPPRPVEQVQEGRAAREAHLLIVRRAIASRAIASRAIASRAMASRATASRARARAGRARAYRDVQVRVRVGLGMSTHRAVCGVQV